MTAPKRTARPRRFDPDTESPWAEDEPKTTTTRSRDEGAPADDDLVSIPISRGRSAIKAERASSSDSASQFFRWGDNGDVQVVKFLDIEPFAYQQHWVTRSGKQSFPCIGRGCPLCEVGSKTSQKIVYSIVNLSVEGGPVAQTLEVTSTIDDTLASYDSDSRTGPLSKRWYALSRTAKTRSGGFGKYDYSILPIKDRDLDEDYGISLEDAEEAVDTIEPTDPEKALGKISRTMLQEIADELMA